MAKCPSCGGFAEETSRAARSRVSAIPYGEKVRRENPELFRAAARCRKSDTIAILNAWGCERCRKNLDRLAKSLSGRHSWDANTVRAELEKAMEAVIEGAGVRVKIDDDGSTEGE